MIKPPALGRRSLVAGAAVSALPMIAGRARAAERITVVTSGGSWQEAIQAIVVEPFSRETGIAVLLVDTLDIAKVKAQVEANAVDWDIFEQAGPAMLNGARQNLFEKLDPAITAGVDLAVNPSPYVVGTGLYAGGIGWDPRRNAAAPRTFAEFWDIQRFPGRRGLRARVSETLEAALLADGVPARQIYPIDMDRAFKSLARIKPAIRKWTQTTSETLSLIQTNELDYSYTYQNRVNAAKAGGVSVDFSISQNIVFPTYYGIPRGSTHRDAAGRFLTFFLRPETQAALAERLGTIPINNAARALMKVSVSDALPDPRAANTVMVDDVWWLGHFEEADRRFKEMLLD